MGRTGSLPRGSRLVARVIALAVLAVVAPAAGALAADSRAPAAGPATFGAAVWWGCVEDDPPPEPLLLRCPFEPDPRYRALLEAEPRVFDVLVPENAMKMPYLQPERGQFDFTVADRLVRFAQERGLTVRGHALVFGKSVPFWLTAPRIPAWTRETLLAELRRHVTTVVRHYREHFPGVVRTWDVVNEPFENDGSYNRNIFYEVIGPDYIEAAFRAAHEADPDAVLLLNEFNADGPGPRADAVLRLARDLVDRGVPIDGIGMQMHLGMDGTLPTSQERRAVMRSYGELGLRVELTEVDVAFPAGLFAPDRGAEQEAIWREVAADCAAVPACTGLTAWGVADRHSWRGPWARALPFDADYRPKPFVDDLLTTLSRGQSRDELLRRPPGPRVSVRRRHRAATVVDEGLRLRVWCREEPPCAVEASIVEESENGARTLARREVEVVGERRTFRLRPTRSGRRRLRAHSGEAGTRRIVLRIETDRRGLTRIPLTIVPEDRDGG